MTLGLGLVLIGRNEGDRLRRALDAANGHIGAAVVYVDSGSGDGSLDMARAAGAQVVALDPAMPFSAARARNAGFAALAAAPGGPPDVVQFIDGDCALVPGWLDAGRAALAGDPGLGLVTGWRRETDRGRSVYNALCDVEWLGPAGAITACAGDMMLRSRAFTDVGGFDERVIAGEDEDICARLDKAGWRLWRLPVTMTLHDAAMTRFGQWWRRAVRGGHAYAHLGDLHPGRTRRERARIWVYAVLLPVLALVGLVFWWPLTGLVVLAYAVSCLRTAQGLMRRGQPLPEALHHALFLSLSKFPNLIGLVTYRLRKWRGAAMRIIEYK